MPKSSSVSNAAVMFICGSAALVMGHLLVTAMQYGVKPVLFLFLVVLLFLGLALFIRDLKTFLLFMMILLIPTGLDYHVSFRPLVQFQSSPFVAGIAVTSVDFLLAILYIYWFALVCLGRSMRRPTLGHPLGTLLLAWIAYSLIASKLTATRFEYSIYEVIVLSLGFLLYFYLVNNLNTHRDLRVVLYALFAGALAQAVYMIGQFVTGLNYTLMGEFYDPRDVVGFRAAGFLGDEVISAQVMAMVFPLGLVYYLKLPDKLSRGVALFCILVGLAGIIAAKHRAAWLAIAVSFVTILAIGVVRKWVASGTVLKGAVVAMLILMLASPFIVTRFRVGTWGEVRIPLARTAISMFKDNWVLGVGASNYSFEIDKYMPVKLRHTWHASVHSEYLLQLVERGVVGAFLYYWLMVAMSVRLWRLTRSSDSLIAAVAAGLFAAMISSFFMRVFNRFHLPVSYATVCVFLALTASMGYLEKKRLTTKNRVTTIGKE